jgi:F0F1-type ATP synthase delta subunit
MSHRIATRYAKSLIELAQEKGKLEEVHTDILQMQTAGTRSSL